MVDRKTGFYRFRKKSSRSSLKTFVHKRLLARLLIAGAVISIALAAAVFFIEFNRLGKLISSRASIVVVRFNEEIRHMMDISPLTATPAIQNKLKMLLIAGKLNFGLGSLIFAGMYDLDGRAILVEKDMQCTYPDAVDAFLKSRKHLMPGPYKKAYEFNRIAKKPHVLLAYPLTNDRNEKVAVINGLFALSSAAIGDVKGRIVRTAVEAIGIVVLITLTIYPIIMTLIGQLSKLAADLLKSNIEILQVLGSAIAKRDSDTDIHNYRVTIYSVSLAEAFGLDRRLIRGLIKGAFLHDVGKIGISDQILLKPGQLTQTEIETMKGHVNHGIDIVNRSDWLKDAQEVVGYHHERFDGKGYPYGLNGESIPLSARIFTIADVFDALTSRRPYKSPIPFDEAMNIIEKGRGTLFDPVLLDAFKDISKSLYDRFSNYSEQTLRESLESITQHYFSN